jgi:hypothetical protein
LLKFDITIRQQWISCNAVSHFSGEEVRIAGDFEFSCAETITFSFSKDYTLPTKLKS